MWHDTYFPTMSCSSPQDLISHSTVGNISLGIGTWRTAVNIVKWAAPIAWSLHISPQHRYVWLTMVCIVLKGFTSVSMCSPIYLCSTVMKTHHKWWGEAGGPLHHPWIGLVLMVGVTNYDSPYSKMLSAAEFLLAIQLSATISTKPYPLLLEDGLEPPNGWKHS